jgi:hypothetical protein
MNTRSALLSAFLSAFRLPILALGIAAAPLSAGPGLPKAQAGLLPAYTFAPATAKAGQGFNLRLVSNGFDCATAFSSVRATVTADAIRLSFLPQELPKGCGDTSHTYGVSFAIPALPAGSYQVWVDRLDRDAAVDAGTLIATEPTEWYLKQRDVAANLPFTMQLLRNDIGNCQTSFSHDTAYVRGSSIYATFVMESHPERVCAKDLRPFGPDFPMPALAPGLYPVLPQQLAPCQVAQPPCLIPVLAPYPTDTLVVAADVVLSLSALRAGASRIEVKGRIASFALPAGKAGIWHAELMDLHGRVRYAARVSGSPGDRVSLPVDRAPAHALSLLRLTSPSGMRHYLAIPR